MASLSIGVPNVLCDCEGVVIFGHCFVVHYLVSFLVLQSPAGAERERERDRERERAGSFTLCILMSFDC